jgi:hypothetical protein
MRRSVLFVLGGSAGAALDQIHVRTGVLSYAAPSRLGQPWWVGPQFGAAAVGILDTARFFAGRVDDPAPGQVLSDMGWFLTSYVATGLVRRRPRALCAGLLVSFVGRIGRRPDWQWVAGYAVLLAAIGCWYEHRLAATHVFGYSEPALGNIPAWLPGLYAQGAPLALDLARALPA